jgi:hypothetical protein
MAVLGHRGLVHPNTGGVLAVTGKVVVTGSVGTRLGGHKCV